MLVTVSRPVSRGLDINILSRGLDINILMYANPIYCALWLSFYPIPCIPTLSMYFTNYTVIAEEFELSLIRN